jgi:hypothetical protein
LERADDDRFARASFPRDGDEAGRQLPLEILDQREVLDAQQSQGDRHSEKS